MAAPHYPIYRRGRGYAASRIARTPGNAGFVGSTAGVVETSEEDWQRVVATNLTLPPREPFSHNPTAERPYEMMPSER
jgi:NAD(P)-dependent dehydrogenase (short-subunit alcohol dehydrogenase family)